MNVRVGPDTHSSWHASAWVTRIHRLLGGAGRVPPSSEPPSRRQVLLALQDARKREQRLHASGPLHQVEHKGFGELHDPGPRIGRK